MVTKLTYDQIKSMSPIDAVHHIQSIEKGFVYNVTTKDLFYEDALDKSLITTIYKDLHPTGVYIFFDENDYVRYIGQSKNGFYSRLISQFDTKPRRSWGWNALLRKIGGERTKKLHDELSEEDHKIDLNAISNYKLVLIDVAKEPDFDLDKIPKLERLLLKAFKSVRSQRLLNTNIGRLTPHEEKKPFNQLLNS